MPYANPSPAFLSEGKLVEIAQLAIHWADAATARPEARIWLGNVSPSITHTTGPHDIPKKNTKALAATSASGPAAPCRTGWPLAPVAAVPKIPAIPPSVTVIPADPTSSSGLRPTLSISAIATSVVTMLIALVITVIASELLSLNPTACHRTLE